MATIPENTNIDKTLVPEGSVGKSNEAILADMPKPKTLEEQYLYAWACSMVGVEYEEPFQKPIWRKEQILKGLWMIAQNVAVTPTPIWDGSVTTKKLADGAVTENKISMYSVTLGKLALYLINTLLDTKDFLSYGIGVDKIDTSKDVTLNVLADKINEIIDALKGRRENMAKQYVLTTDFTAIEEEAGVLYNNGVCTVELASASNAVAGQGIKIKVGEDFTFSGKYVVRSTDGNTTVNVLDADKNDTLQILADTRKMMLDKASELVEDHNTDSTAHEDIRTAITESVSNHNADTTAHDDIRQSLTDHNKSTTAHADIRQAVSAASIAVASSPSFYQRADKPSSAKTTITMPKMWVNVNTGGYVLTTPTTLDLSKAASWDSSTYATAANRAGKDFYFYAIQPASGTTPKFILSANSTVPIGYTADNSRKLGGFHCLCADVGTIDGHTLSGYVAGDILPNSVWDLKFRAISENEGMVWVPEVNQWVDIYMTSYQNGKAASVYGGTMLDGDSEPKIHGDKAAELLGLVGKHLPWRDDFVVYAKGSNEGTNIKGSANPNTSGGHSDTAGRRMISNYGVEDCCGAQWEWGRDQYEYFVGATHDGSNQYLSGYSWKQYPVYHADIDGSNKYGQCLGLLRRVLFGGYWGDGAYCGSRSAYCNNCPARRDGSFGARGLSELRSAM